jgi:hypothetical protein
MESLKGKLSKDEIKSVENRGNSKGANYEKDFVSKRFLRKKPTIYRSKIKYDFLQYTRIVFQWATKKYGITRANLELLLFLFPQGNFPSALFMKICRIHTIQAKSLLKKMKIEGFIIVWREANRNKGQKILYCLSDKSKKMCAKMHSIMAGDDVISDYANPFISDELCINKYYMTLIKDMNKETQKRMDILKKEKAAK